MIKSIKSSNAFFNKHLSTLFKLTNKQQSNQYIIYFRMKVSPSKYDFFSRMAEQVIKIKTSLVGQGAAQQASKLQTLADTATQQKAINMNDAFVNNGKVFKTVGRCVLGVIVGIAIIQGIRYLIYEWKNNNDQPQNQAQNLIGEIPSNQIIKFPQQEIDQASSISSAELKQAYEELKCGITHMLMTKPTLLPCGHSFSRHAINIALTKKPRCPLCNQPASVQNIFPNLALEKTIERFRKKAAKKGQQWVSSRIQVDFGKQIN